MKRLIKSIVNSLGLWIFNEGSLPPGVNWILDARKTGLDKEGIIFDIGANVGQTAVELARSLPNAKIFSFEPFKSTFQELQRNTLHLSKVKCYPIAMGANPETMKVYPRHNSLFNSLKKDPSSPDQHGDGETITVETISRFCRDNKVDFIDLLKIDTEGFELEVLKGAAPMLEEGKVKFVYAEVCFSSLNEQNSNFFKVYDFLVKDFRFLGLYESYPLLNFQEANAFCNALFVHRSPRNYKISTEQS